MDAFDQLTFGFKMINFSIIYRRAWEEVIYESGIDKILGMFDCSLTRPEKCELINRPAVILTIIGELTFKKLTIDELTRYLLLSLLTARHLKTPTVIRHQPFYF